MDDPGREPITAQKGWAMNLPVHMPEWSRPEAGIIKGLVEL